MISSVISPYSVGLTWAIGLSSWMSSVTGCSAPAVGDAVTRAIHPNTRTSSFRNLGDIPYRSFGSPEGITPVAADAVAQAPRDHRSMDRASPAQGTRTGPRRARESRVGWLTCCRHRVAFGLRASVVLMCNAGYADSVRCRATMHRRRPGDAVAQRLLDDAYLSPVRFRCCADSGAGFGGQTGGGGFRRAGHAQGVQEQGRRPASPAAPPAGQDACFPPCRKSYVCVRGQCVSACNPPCSAGERCTAEGECVR